MALVLIADNDTDARGELAKILSGAGHQIMEAKTGPEVLKTASESEPDLMLLDIHLPGTDTLELLEELRAEANLARTPIIMMSKEADPDILTKTFRWDIVDFITKPFHADVLAAKVGAHTRMNLAYKFSRKLSKEMYMGRIERLEMQMNSTDEDLTEAERHFTWMQPKAPKIDGYKIDVTYMPYGRLGGDFYDFVWLDRDRLAVVVGDISGHGIQAAILQAMSRKLISLALRQEDGDLPKVIEFANRELINDLPPGSFVAAVIGVLHTRTNNWRHVRCGVPYPMLVSGKEVENLVTPGGPLGLSKKPDWHTQVEV
ncbi:MAG: response regulator, partial [Nitrospira sp.]|nr:response regulator [Nitrospira sp.]